jgi:phosphate transport system permease protein
MSARPVPSMPEVALTMVIATMVSVAASVMVALLLQQAPPVLGRLVRRALGLAAPIPMVVVAVAVLVALPAAGAVPSPVRLALLLAATTVLTLSFECDRIVRGVTSPLRDAAAALGVGTLRMTLTLVLPAASPAALGALLTATAQGLGALLTLGALHSALSSVAATALPAPVVTMTDVVPLALAAGLITLATSTLIGVYIEDFSEGSRWTHAIDRVIVWLSAVPPLVYAALVLVVGADMGNRRPGAGSAAALLALLLGPHAALAVRSVLATVPASLREASRALGATRRQTLRHLVLPAAVRPLLGHLFGALVRATLEWLPLLALGTAVFRPTALPTWLRTLDLGWISMPDLPWHVSPLPVTPGRLDVPAVIWLIAALSLVPAWLTPTLRALPERRL